ncbi:alpha/beta hydrolase family protein [Sphingobium sp. C100]|uniref:alpha/beta hydrolase family protein n=1 Tax=Sphingobium sp. C100 TaxID=1207055 RepID=UPI0004113149|nr:prolyl oligopeptidase family serine peptidase [Sphingobium sp. C100]
MSAAFRLRTLSGALLAARPMVSTPVLFLSLLSLAGAPIAPAEAKAARHLDVRAMLQFAEVGDPVSLGWRDYRPQIASFAPDGRNVAIVVRNGAPVDGTVNAKLLIYDVEDVMKSQKQLPPLVAAEFSSRSNQQPLASVRWLDDGLLQFAATGDGSTTQIYNLSLKSGQVRRLTDVKFDMLAFGSSASGDQIVAISRGPAAVSPENDPECISFGCRVSGRRLADALAGARSWHTFASKVTYYDLQADLRREVDAPSERAEVDRCFADTLPGGVSPDGRYALQICSVTQWPSWWTRYTVDSEFVRSLLAKNYIYLRQYYLLDLKSGTSRPLNSTPALPVMRADPIWIDGGRHLILPGAVLPLNAHTALPDRNQQLGAMIVDPATGSTKLAFALDPAIVHRIVEARWSERDQILVIDAVNREGEALDPIAWRRAGEKWERVGPSKISNPSKHYTIYLEQSINSVPVVYLQNAKGVRRALLAPNEWLEDYRLGLVQAISWTGKGSSQWKGHLYLPPDYKLGKKYPLVILTHGLREGVFSLWGYARNFAAQPLASRGIVVLQLDETGLRGVTTTREEWPRSQEGFESAIDELDKRGLIDRSRVGLVGWSRTVNHVNYMMTHSDYPIKATILADGNDFGWWTYLNRGVHQEIELNFGAEPFGSGLGNMLNLSPTFSLDRWRTPTLIWTSQNAISSWDIFAGLRRLKKPVEYWVLPDADHDIFMMTQRSRLNQQMVDWFAFWLGDEEREHLNGLPGETKGSLLEQYIRWNDLRAQQNEVLKTSRPPRLEWSSRAAK